MTRAGGAGAQRRQREEAQKAPRARGFGGATIDSTTSHVRWCSGSSGSSGEAALALRKADGRCCLLRRSLQVARAPQHERLRRFNGLTVGQQRSYLKDPFGELEMEDRSQSGVDSLRPWKI